MKIVEATLVMPLTILITAAMITITVGMYQNLKEQVENHEEEIKAVYEDAEAQKIKIWDKAKEPFE